MTKDELARENAALRKRVDEPEERLRAVEARPVTAPVVVLPAPAPVVPAWRYYCPACGGAYTYGHMCQRGMIQRTTSRFTEITVA